ncbi:MFS transporter [Caenimonas terrae]|uniref:MFS transporter n=1 Tax=Caenimonas terrae TaxID=696074 RepID=A0ABW0NJ94_9BURK
MLPSINCWHQTINSANPPSPSFPAAAAEPAHYPGLPLPQRYHAMGVIIMGIALSVLDGTVVNLALPGIVRDLHSTPSHAVWVINAYQLATLALLLPLATLGDRVGYRRVYLAGVSIFTAASIGCMLARSLPALATARAVQGVGAAGIMAVNAALVRLTYPSPQLGRGIALNSVVVAVASVAGPTVAAGVLSVASWPWLFAINVPLGVLLLALGFRALPHNAAPPAGGARLSPVDVVLNASMFVLLFLAADILGARSGTTADRSTAMTGLAMLALAIGVGVLYVRRQRGRQFPLLPVDLLRIPVFALSMCTSVGAFTAQTLAYIALPFLMLDAWGLGPLRAGLLLTCWPLAIVASAPIAGRLIGRYPGGLLGGVGLAVLAAGLALLAAAPAHPAAFDVAWRMAVCGFGFGLFQSPNNHTIITSAPVARSGAASGMLGTARLTGQSAGAVLLAGIFSFSSVHDGRGPAIALALAAGFAAVAAVFSALRVRH